MKTVEITNLESSASPLFLAKVFENETKILECTIAANSEENAKTIALENAEKINSVAVEYVKTYSDYRREAYPQITDQLDILYHQGIEGWKSVIQSVKDKFPKE
jgi:hypothetical protein